MAITEINGLTADSQVIVKSMTETERDALTAVAGMIIYNTTTSVFNFYEDGSWVAKANVA